MNQQEGGLSINGMGSAPVGRKKKKNSIQPKESPRAR